MTTNTISHNFYAISGLGWGRGETPDAARKAYVETQLRNYQASMTVFKTKPKFRAALESGELAPDVWQPPTGTVGFVIDHRGLMWYDADDNYTPAAVEQRVESTVS